MAERYLQTGSDSVRWWWVQEYFEVTEIKVNPEYRRRGVATAIYDSLRAITCKKLRWIRNAFASEEMIALADKYLQSAEVVSDEGNVIFIAPP